MIPAHCQSWRYYTPSALEFALAGAFMRMRFPCIKTNKGVKSSKFLLLLFMSARTRAGTWTLPGALCYKSWLWEGDSGRKRNGWPA